MTEQRALRLDQAVEAFALTSVALADAFLSCWYGKFRINLVRPITYVRRVMGKSTWSTFVNSPQFPEYTSGHSVSSMAAATVLTDLLGSFPFFDDTHANYPLPPRPGRSHNSFVSAAEEAANSRIYGGIHYPMGIEAGKEQGVKVGDIVLTRLRTRRT